MLENQNLWAGTNAGIDIIQNNKIAHLHTNEYLSNGQINNFFTDKSGRIWIATENGIYVIFDQKIYHFSEKNGLISNRIKSISQDINGNIWLATTIGLSLLIPLEQNRFSIQNFNNAYGANITDFGKSALALKNGDMIWTTNSDVLKFNSEFYFELKNELELDVFSQDGLKINQNEKIIIKPGGRYKVDLRTIFWGIENEIKYSYAIINSKNDTSWTHLNKNHIFTLRDLAKGKYKLLVKTEALNYLSETKIFNLEVLPFWYETLAFRASIILIIIFIATMVVFIQKRRAKRIQKLLETEVDKKTKELKKENKIKEALLSEIHHRVKNNLQTIHSLLYLQIQNSTETQKQVLKETSYRLNSMAIVHEMLYSSDNISEISAKSYLEELVLSFYEMTENFDKQLEIKKDIDDTYFTATSCIAIGMIVNEAVTNSIKYAFENTENPTIEIALKLKNNHLYLKIADNGSGIIEKEKAFSKKSIGMTLIEIFAEQLNAKLKTNSQNGFKIELKIPNNTQKP